MTHGAALQLSTLMVALGLAVAALEDLFRYEIFRDRGLLSWPIARLRARWTDEGLSGRLLERVMREDRFRYVLGAVLAISLVAPILLLDRRLHAVVALALLGGVLLVSVRSLYGLDGSDQMSLVILSGVTVAVLAPQGSVASQAATWFVAIQLTLAYAVSGVAKLVSPVWRGGGALAGVMSTSSYGSRQAHRLLLRHPGLGRMVEWAVIVLETSFVAVFILPPGPRMLLLTAMLAFHAGCALLMGLNNFLIAFAAAYPILWYCTERVHAAI